MPLSTLLELHEAVRTIRRRQLIQAFWQGTMIIFLFIIGLRVYGIL